MGRRPRQRALSLQNLRPERQRVDAPGPSTWKPSNPVHGPVPAETAGRGERRCCSGGRATPALRPAQPRPPPSAPPRPAQRSAPPSPAPRPALRPAPPSAPPARGPPVRMAHLPQTLPPLPPPVRILSPLLSLSLSGFSVIVSCLNVCLPCWISCLVR